MKVKLGFRVALLTGMLLLLVSTYKTQPVAACSPGWYDGCVSACWGNWGNCVSNGIPVDVCSDIRNGCQGNCDRKLAACQND
jgi:hypothetical protein